MNIKITLSKNTAFAILAMLRSEEVRTRNNYYTLMDRGPPYLKEYESMMNRAAEICNEFEFALAEVIDS